MNIDKAVSQVEKSNFNTKGQSKKKFQVRTVSNTAEEDEDPPVTFVKTNYSSEYG